MLVNELLTDDYRYKWAILKLIDSNKNAYFTIRQISSLLEISVYKVEKYIEEINIEIKSIQCDASIEVSPEKEVYAIGFKYLLLKKLRTMYLNKCEFFNIFHNFVVFEMPLKKQIQQLYISQSNIYLYCRDLKTVLNDEGLVLQRNSLQGNELNLRSILFSTYYELFNGVENPFPKTITKLSLTILKQLSKYFLLSIPKTKELKLSLFITIWITRLKNEHYINKRYVAYLETDFIKWLRKFLLSSLIISEEVLEDEIAYLMMFCHFEIEDIEFISHFNSSEIDQQAHEITEVFSDLFLKRFNYDLTDTVEHIAILSEIKNINRKWLIYHFREQTFIIKAENNYFEEVNPELDFFLKEFINVINEKKLFMSDSERNKFYYDYLFLLVTKLSLGKIEIPLYICIDFSHGENYNNYIRMMLSSLQSMNIHYESRITNHTDLFLSDCAMDKLNCQQLIWKKPPTANDWRELGDVLVKIKEKDCER